MSDEITLNTWQRTQATKQTVHIVECCYDYEGSEVHSVHTTLEGAQAEANRCLLAHGHRHIISHAVVQQ